MGNIKNRLVELARRAQEMRIVVCRVDEVNRARRTVYCTPIDESAPLPAVNLQANQGGDTGVVVFPKQGSYVIVGVMNTGGAAAVLLTDEVESIEIDVPYQADTDNGGIVLNGGSLGGLVKIEALTEKLNGLVDVVNGLIRNYNAHTHTYSATPTAGTTAIPLDPADSASAFERNDYEDKSIKH